MRRRLEEWWQCLRIDSLCRHFSRTCLACSECRSNSFGCRRREWSISHRDLLRRLAEYCFCRRSFGLVKEVIQRAVIIHPPFRRGMLPTSNQERGVGIMVFKLDKRKVISPCQSAHSIVIHFVG